MSNVFIDHLNSFTEADWLAAVEELLPCVHEVDRNALQIWFRFYPLSLQRYLAEAEDRDEAVRGLALLGRFELKDQIDTSHHFLYGHRYWPVVKRKIEKMLSEPPASAGSQSGKKASTSGPSPGASILDLVKDLAMRVAEKTKVDRPLVNAIAAVGLMTLNQGGVEAFESASGEVVDPAGLMKKSPDQIVAERAKDDSQGIFGFLKTIDKKFSIRYAASDYAGRFPVYTDQEITLASANDQSKNWKELDERCWEGPVPVECTSASCGTCWVGILGGQEKMNEVGPRERRQMKVFGYKQPDAEKPFLRLACQSRAYGNVTLVIPPWNGVFGKKVYNNVEELDLEPVTTSAKALRETIAAATDAK